MGNIMIGQQRAEEVRLTEIFGRPPVQIGQRLDQVLFIILTNISKLLLANHPNIPK